MARTVTDDDLRRRLIQVARRKATVTYGELSPDAPRSLWHPLDRINAVEVAEGRPSLTAVVVNKDLSKPGNGFFGWVRRWAASTAIIGTPSGSRSCRRFGATGMTAGDGEW